MVRKSRPNPKHGNRKYPWEEWFNQLLTARDKTGVLVRGEHYQCSTSSMIQSIRNEASVRRLRISVRDERDRVTVEVTGEVSHTDKVTVTT